MIYNYEKRVCCNNCPFLKGTRMVLREDRTREIYDGLLKEDRPFFCHKFLDGNLRVHCAGALIVCEKNNRPHQAMRLAQHAGKYDPKRLRMKTEVYLSADEKIKGDTNVILNLPNA